MDCVGKKQRVPGAVAGHTDDKEHVVVAHFGTVQCTVDLGTTVHNSLVQYTKHTSVQYTLVQYTTLQYTSVDFSTLVQFTALHCNQHMFATFKCRPLYSDQEQQSAFALLFFYIGAVAPRQQERCPPKSAADSNASKTAPFLLPLELHLFLVSEK